MKYPLSATAILRVQKRLQELVIYHGKIDGILGPLTLRSIKGFQRISGLEQDGYIGPLTEAALFPKLIPGVRIEKPHPDDPKGSAIVWPYEKDVEKFYGEKGKNQAQVKVPYPMVLAWDLSVPVHSITVHEKVAKSVERCLGRINDTYSASQRKNLGIDLFGGSLAVRRKRGGTGWSMHSWGIAIDFDPARNQLRWGRDKARLAQPDGAAFFRIWQEEGFVSLGVSRNYDWMHVQAARLG